MQGSGQARGVIVPEQNIEYRRLIAQQVIVHPVVPDQIVGAHPGEDLRHVLALQDTALIGHAPRRFDGFFVSKERDLGLDTGVQDADQQGEGADFLLFQGCVVAQ